MRLGDKIKIDLIFGVERVLQRCVLYIFVYKRCALFYRLKRSCTCYTAAWTSHALKKIAVIFACFRKCEKLAAIFKSLR